MTKDELIQMIEDAFDGVEQPQDITLHVAEAIDEYRYNDLDEERKKDFFGRWQDIPIKHIEECQAALSYLTPIGMRFYLPAYMIDRLNDNFLTNAALCALRYTSEDDQGVEHFQKRFSLFNKQQLTTCAEFLKFYALPNKYRDGDEHFAQEQLDRYWHQYL